GGWGDTTRSASNLSTTLLSWATLKAGIPLGSGPIPAHDGAVARAEAWIRERVGSLDARAIARAVVDTYGEDRTFSVPILTHCAIAGVFGKSRSAWKHVLPLPFELAALPRSWFGRIGLPVVSYALPALIAIGLVRYERAPPRDPFRRLVRRITRSRVLRVLEAIQPASGGFLEATPLTSFVAMSLFASGHWGTEAVRAVHFLVNSVRHDGSWPIDTDLATWVTTLSVRALCASSDLGAVLSDDERDAIRTWLLGQQYREVHPYTCAAPGAWAWTDLSGGVPDADDTPGALLALRELGGDAKNVLVAAKRGVAWLLDLQNRDGGMPTFCRGWGKLPFDRSGADLTAHAIRAWLAWRESIHADSPRLGARVDRAISSGLRFLAATQRADGSWVPLWFGNESAAELANPTYGTSRVVIALSEAMRAGHAEAQPLRERAIRWIIEAQGADGGWGGEAGVRPSVEETGLALEALADRDIAANVPPALHAIERGSAWLARALRDDRHLEPTPIGFYFAKLWYFERLYPLVFALAGLGRARAILGSLAESKAAARSSHEHGERTDSSAK
ncbi:MAG TPA: prenyltransferase/squalene oxidase repeat-containing protein, partial [Planctomycetota bacterium]|nr:prenyltransferase/squalene oxidase repeat-containing protein [Planctomycetota bacterium]